MQQDRDYVRPSEGLAPRRDAIRQVPKAIPLLHRTRSNRLVLALKINESGAQIVTTSIFADGICNVINRAMFLKIADVHCDDLTTGWGINHGSDVGRNCDL